MSRILFEDQRPAIAIDPGRADVACFVGLVRYTGGSGPAVAIPAVVKSWLSAQGWLDGPNARPIGQLFDLPIPVETWNGFTAMFDPGGSSASFGTDYLAAAVRTFFAQGGKRCYVVRMGDPVTPSDTPAQKQGKLAALLPGSTFRPDDPRSWTGVGHLSGLPEVSFLAIPDLPVLVASGPSGAAGKVPVTPSGPEQFVECSQADITPPQNRLYGRPAPRLLPGDYAAWAAAVRTVLVYLSQGSLREIQFVAALPLPQDLDIAEASENPSSTALAQDIHDAIKAQMKEVTGLAGSISSAFLQLSYPWLKTTGSHALLESLEPPDGALTGILARNALTRGAFTSATKIAPSEVFDTFPALPMRETSVSSVPLTWGNDSAKPLIERISLFGPTPAGLRLLSDVTAYPGESYRPARVNRLVSVIARASRRLGEDSVFERNGEALWGRVRAFLQQLMTRLWSLGALDGASARDAFSVRCDRSTMTQNDLDNGRLVAVVSFTAAATLELIRVTLALGTSGASEQTISALAVEVR